MRLLNTSSLELKEFHSISTPYAILSHTWGEDEVLFDDIRTKTAVLKQGFAKVAGCCKKAAADGYQWVWIDTCCIDKSSSAELSEAINSMYQWYRKSAVCYAYLADVTTDRASTLHGVHDYTESRWFTRGWTLQELIAPTTVEFYTREWAEIGTRASLSGQLEQATGIRSSVLLGGSPRACSVAERMSWIARRSTKLEEDLAYSLLGLFGVNMPLLYGEGARAFIRLQEQILEREEDYTIFAWSFRYDSRGGSSGILASSPLCFSKATKTPDHIRRPTADDSAYCLPSSDGSVSEPWYELHRGLDYSLIRPHNFLATDSHALVAPQPPELTSRGLRISLPVLETRNPDSPIIAFIYCTSSTSLVCVLLRKLPSTNYGFLWVRGSPTWMMTLSPALLNNFVLKDMFVRPDGIVDPSDTSSLQLPSNFDEPGSMLIEVVSPFRTSDSTSISTWPPDLWKQSKFIYTRGHPVGGVLFRSRGPNSVSDSSLRFAVRIGRHERRWCCEIKDLPPTDTGDLDLSLMLSSFESEANLSDRAAIRTMDGTMVLHATFRRHPLPAFHPGWNRRSTRLIVTIGICTPEQCPTWASMSLPPLPPLPGSDSTRQEP